MGDEGLQAVRVSEGRFSRVCRGVVDYIGLEEHGDLVICMEGFGASAPCFPRRLFAMGFRCEVLFLLIPGNVNRYTDSYYRRNIGRIGNLLFFILGNVNRYPRLQAKYR